LILFTIGWSLLLLLFILIIGGLGEGWFGHSLKCFESKIINKITKSIKERVDQIKLPDKVIPPLLILQL